MANVAFKRDIAAYKEAVDQYQQMAKSHNAKVDAYRSSFIQDENGDIKQFTSNRGLYSGGDQALNTKDYEGVSMGAGKYAVRPRDSSNPAMPGDFTASPPGNNPVQGYSKGYIQGLDQPSPSDLERNTSSGLIGSSLNYQRT